MPLAAALSLAAVATLDPERRDALLAVATSAARACFGQAHLLVGAVAQPAESERSATVPDRPLVGRARELASLHARFRSVQGGTHQLCRLTGESGIGKTRLAQELAAQVADAGSQVCWIRVPDGSSALWPWTQMARNLASGTDLTELTASLGPEADPLLALVLGRRRASGPLDTVAVADAIARLLAWSTRQRPLLVVLDDMQRADVDAVRVLTAVEQSLAGVRAMIVVAYRDEEVGPDFDELVGGRPVIRLGGVHGSDLAAMVALELESAPPARLVDAIGRVTGGNPAFIQESIHGFRLAAGGGAAAEPPVPDGARHVITQRLAGCGPTSATCFASPPASGRPSTSTCWPLSPDATSGPYAVACAGRRSFGLVAATLHSGWRFAGEAARRVLAERVEEDAAARFHASAADHLELRAAVSDDAAAATIAAHLLATRGVAPERLVRWVGAAADQLLQEGGAEQAAALVARGLAVVGPDPAARGALLHRLGLARRAAGSERTARAAFLGAANAARTVRDGDLFAQATLAFARCGLEPSTGRTDAVPLLEEALEVAPGDDAIRARVEAALAVALAGDRERGAPVASS